MIEVPDTAHYCLGDGLGYVALLDHVGDDTSIVNAARVSFGKRVEEMSDKDAKLIRFLIRHQHGTPLEHNSQTFLVKCPMFVARQWHRHRVGISINEISGRYVEMQDEFYIPAEFRRQATHNRQASVEGEVPSGAQESYLLAVEAAYKSYRDLLEMGVAREQARAVLPLCTYTMFYWTCNLRSLLHFVELRDHADAQWEIQQYAKAMLEQVRPVFPVAVSVWEEIHSNHDDLDAG
jgi:thymidylate synthase (FAD)